MTSQTTEAHTDLLARAAAFVDTLDDIDQIATLGGPMDTLATLLRDIVTLEAVYEVASTGADLHRIVDVLARQSTTQWRIDWLLRTTGCAQETAQHLASVDRSTLRRHALIEDPHETLIAMRMGADLAAEDVADALRQHPDSSTVVPDTVPQDWAA